jgi:hypothetical protein
MLYKYKQEYKMNITSDETPHININHPGVSSFDEQLEVRVGQRSSRIKVINDATKKTKRVRINRYAAEILLLPADLQIEYKVINSNPAQIKLGPVVGILTTVKRNNKSGLPTGKEAQYLGEMISYARQYGVFIYLFYSNGVNWANKTIKGYTLNFLKYSSNIWMEGEYPLPDIVYNRIRSRYIEQSNMIINLLEQFEYAGIYLFNTRFLDKWEVYKTLQNSPLLMSMLPPTALFNYESLCRFLEKYPELFLKPRNSSIGKGIIKVKRMPGYYMFALAQSSKPSWYRYSSPEKLYEAIIDLMPDKSRYLVQMGIALAKINNRIFDLRVQVQKNGKGKWVLTGVGVRAAAPERFVTHIPNGGSAQPYKEVIERIFGYSAEIKSALDRQLQLITNETPVVLENSPGLKLAILAIDIGIDERGKMWIIEVNSKPSSFDEQHIRHAHIKNFTEYCKYISSDKTD